VAGDVVSAKKEQRPKQVNQSLLTVLVAFLVNVLIAIAKSVAAVIPHRRPAGGGRARGQMPATRSSC
jgi:hypothetical protein